MFRYHGLTASGMYWRGQRVSAVYYRGLKIWTANPVSPPLRKGVLELTGFTAIFGIIAPSLNKGDLLLTPKMASFSLYGALSQGSLSLHGESISFQERVNLAKGQLQFTGFGLTTQQKGSLASGDLQITGFSGSFLLVGGSITDISIDNSTINGDTLIIGTLSVTGGTIPITYTVL